MVAGFKRMALPSQRNSVIDKTATGIDADTVRPTLSPRYTDEAAKMMPRIEPMISARTVSSVTFASEAMNGLKSSPLTWA